MLGSRNDSLYKEDSSGRILCLRTSEQESASLDAFPRVSNNGNYPILAVTLRTANDSITRVTPLMIMLTPTKVPIAQPELDGHCR
jgi:hypothetical protein